MELLISEDIQVVVVLESPIPERTCWGEGIVLLMSNLEAKFE